MTARRSITRAVAHKPLGMVAAAWLGIVILASVAAPLIAPFGPNDQDLAHVLSGPTAHHWLGTGVLGRDIFSRVVYGGRVTLLGVLIAGALYVMLGVPLGVAAGYLGGIIERLVLRLADVAYAVPVIIILLVVVAIFPNNEAAAMVTLGLLGAPGLARIVRSVVAAQRHELYIKAAQVSGLTAFTIMRRHLLPRLAGTVVVQLSIFAAGAVLLETGLGFLGIGNDNASWGQLIAEASQNLSTQPWLLVPSGLIVVTFILALGLLGDAIRDAVAEQHGDTSTTRAPRGIRPSAAQRRPTRRRGHAPAPRPAPTTACDPAALLSVRDLSVAFASGATDVTVVSRVGFDVFPGQTLGILGESGCGKSVTAAAILGLLSRGGHVTAGVVAFDGQDLLAATGDRLRAVRGGKIGWISQEPINSLDPSFTVGSQLVETIRAHRRCSRAAARARAVELLTLVRLPDPRQLVRRYPHQLSGGMAQRVGIAAALAAEPKLLIADEPTTALDVTVQAEILDLLRDLQQTGMAIMLVTHDWGVVSDICDSAVVMYAGQVVEHASVRDLVRHPRHPYTAALLAANPHHARPGEALPAIEGSVPAPTEWPAGCRFANRCPLVRPDCTQAPIPLHVLDDRSHTGPHTSRCNYRQVLAAAESRADDTAPVLPGSRAR
jgi:peptide/nickel transport system permease protein